MITAFAITAWISIQCMAEAAFWESKYTTQIDQISVLYVIKNRVDSRDREFYNDACAVVHRPKRFEYYWDGRSERIPEHERSAYGPALINAFAVYYGWMEDPTEGATDYHDHSEDIQWPYAVEIMRTDYFVFYKRKNVMELAVNSMGSE